MKTLLKIALLLLLVSCSSTKMIDLGNKASTEGINVCQRAIEIYTLLSDQADIDKSQQDRIKVLTNPDPATMTLPDVKTQDFSSIISARIQAYKNLSNTYRAFRLLADDKYSDRTQEAVSALQNSYNSIEKLPNLPEKVSSILPEVSKMITRVVQAKKIKTHNEVMYVLTSVFLVLWNEEEKIWYEYLDRIYNDYATGLNAVDSKTYDVKQITRLSGEPYTNESIIILMYRLNKRDEIIKHKMILRNNCTTLGRHFRH